MTESESSAWEASASGSLGSTFSEWAGQYRKGKAWSFVGPAFIAGTAYVDPGNFVSNMAAGSRYGSQLLWIVLYANIAAMAMSVLVARLGVVSGRNVAENCHEHLPRALSWVLWLAPELAGLAIDFAEVLGATMGLRLLLG